MTDKTLYQSALSLAGCLTDGERARGQVFPSVARIREVSEEVAVAVVASSVEQGLATRISPEIKAAGHAGLRAFLRRKTYNPFYTPLGIDPYHRH